MGESTIKDKKGSGVGFEQGGSRGMGPPRGEPTEGAAPSVGA